MARKNSDENAPAYVILSGSIGSNPTYDRDQVVRADQMSGFEVDRLLAIGAIRTATAEESLLSTVAPVVETAAPAAPANSIEALTTRIDRIEAQLATLTAAAQPVEDAVGDDH